MDIRITIKGAFPASAGIFWRVDRLSKDGWESRVDFGYEPTEETARAAAVACIARLLAN